MSLQGRHEAVGGGDKKGQRMSVRRSEVVTVDPFNTADPESELL